jgi:hypothetical protein
MTDVNAAAFPQPKPTILDILVRAMRSDESETDVMMRIKEHHPEATRDEFEAERATLESRLAWLHEDDERIVPVDWVVDRILKQALDAVVRRSTERPAARPVLDAAADSIAQHPAQQSIILSLAMQQLELILDEVAHERGISLSYSAISRPAVVEATEEEWNAVEGED